MSHQDCYIIVGDVGGTNSRLRLLRQRQSSLTVTFEKVYPSQKYAEFDQVVQAFISECWDGNGVLETACLAVAGPVKDRRATITNVDWVLDERVLQKRLLLKKVALLNDFVAIGYGVLELNHPTLSRSRATHTWKNPYFGGKRMPVCYDRTSDLLYLHVPEQKQASEAPIACIGPGTGLGETFLIPTRGHRPNRFEYQAFPSEGGHADVGVRHDLESELVSFAQQALGVKRVSVERLAAGPGLWLTFWYLSTRYPELVSSAALKAILGTRQADRPRVIGEWAYAKHPCVVCLRALSLFVRINAAEAGNLAVKLLAYGGVYICGGVPPKLLRAFMGCDQAGPLSASRFMNVGERKSGPFHCQGNADVKLPTAVRPCFGCGYYACRCAVPLPKRANKFSLRYPPFSFMFHFLDKGRMSVLLHAMPVSLVLNSQVGLLGASLVGKRLVRDLRINPRL